MASAEFSDRTAIARLKHQLSEAVEQAFALAWAIARLEGKPEGVEAARVARDALRDAMSFPTTDIDSNVVSFNRGDVRSNEPSRAPESGPSVQELILAILKENEVSVRELQTALDDNGMTVSPGNLSVILSRMNQAGLIQRSGRGLYRFAR